MAFKIKAQGYFLLTFFFNKKRSYVFQALCLTPCDLELRNDLPHRAPGCRKCLLSQEPEVKRSTSLVTLRPLQRGSYLEW